MNEQDRRFGQPHYGHPPEPEPPSFAGYTLRDLMAICRQRRSNPHVYRSAAMAALPFLVARLDQELQSHGQAGG